MLGWRDNQLHHSTFTNICLLNIFKMVVFFRPFKTCLLSCCSFFLFLLNLLVVYVFMFFHLQYTSIFVWKGTFMMFLTSLAILLRRSTIIGCSQTERRYRRDSTWGGLSGGLRGHRGLIPASGCMADHQCRVGSVPLRMRRRSFSRLHEFCLVQPRP